MPEEPEVQPRTLPARQKYTVFALAVFLIAGGVLVLFFLEKVPRPMRILSGLGDVFLGFFLLVLLRQKSRRE